MTLLNPNVVINKTILKDGDFDKVVLSRFNSPLNEYDSLVSVYLSYHLNIIIDIKKVEKLFLENLKRFSRSESKITEYANLMGLNLKK